MYNNDEKTTTGAAVLIKIMITFAGLLLGFIISRAFILPYTVNDDSMKPNLVKGDKILIQKTKALAKGDIVLSTSPVEPDRVLLKRIIASENDTIEIRNKIIYINNIKSKFKWENFSTDPRIFPITFSQRDNMPAIKLKRKEYFLYGDNIDYSFDSRTFGIIHGNMIIGKLLYKF